ncbi:cysteine proteinase [Teratosphaeria nubilosa]|uniref:Cysteine proteinase n=1 Tax=Teratosphaeria nubilosa TaxID=161662 RepID=A0A6G1LDF3_9PEZI|nr:cysteine proteinase [Teratosphaeria nubilosa]
MAHLPKGQSVRDARNRFSSAQIRQYYERIDLPTKYRYEPGDFSKEVVKQRDGHGFLNALQRHTLAHVPFENLELHYSSHHSCSVNADSLFERIVRSGKGRGAYCIASNIFFGTILRSLGYEVMSVGARINTYNQHNGEDSTSACFGGRSHMINIVTIRRERFVVDVGFGVGGPTIPIPLKEDEELLSMPPNEYIRVRKGSILEAEHPDIKMWILERRSGQDGSWTPLYCFEDSICFLTPDFEVMTYWTSTSRKSFYTYRIITSKYIIDEAKEAVIGDVALYDDHVVRRIRGRPDQEIELKTEEDRVEALEKFIGIRLTDAEKAGITGMVTELPLEDSEFGE